MRCTYCGSNKHPYKYCPKTWGGASKRNSLRCSYCGNNKHNRDACPKAWPGPHPLRILD